MAEQNISENKSKKSVSQAGTMPLSDIFFMTLRHWPWILVSIVVCVGAAYLHLLRTPTVYTRAAEIIIKEDTKGRSIGADEFAKIGLIQSKTNIQNEVSNLKAKDLMEEVVKRLDLNINYYREGRFHNSICYGSNLPVKVKFAGLPDNESATFDLKVSGDGKVSIENIRHREMDLGDKWYSGMLNDSIATPIGDIVVTPAAGYAKGRNVSLFVSKNSLIGARDSYNSRLGVTMDNEESTVVKLSISDQSVQRADDVLNTLIDVYNENWIRDKNQIAVSTSNFINDRLSVIEKELGHVDSDISSYKSQNLIPDVNAAASMYMTQSQEMQAKLFELNNQLQMARYVRSYLTTEGNEDQLLPANTGVDGNNIQSLINEYNKSLLQYKALLAKSSSKNPLVLQLSDQLADQRRVIVHSVDNEIVSLRTQIKNLQGNDAQITSRLASNPTQAKNLLSVERQQKVKESLYLFLLQKREENELSQAFTAFNTRVINRPGASGVPPTPNRRKILFMAFALGLLIPFGLTYVKETLNSKVRGRKDIEHLSVPFIGEIPLYGENREKTKFGKEKRFRTIVVKSGKRDVINEAFRVLRTNLEFMKINKDEADVVAITSFNPGSGKSFLTMNIAVALALKKKRVLVIDGDMRHGSTSAYVNSPEFGLSDYLNGNIDDLKKLLVVNEQNPSLCTLPVGTIPPNPTELLGTARFKQLIESTKKEYDYVLIDCPPIEVVADAQIIDKLTDRTVFVLRAGLFERSLLPQVEKIYDENKFNRMAIILNGTPSANGYYGYGHTYRYGYGYGYGYGYNYTPTSTKK